MKHARPLGFAVVLLLVAALPGFAQSAAGVPGSSAPPATAPGAGNSGSNTPGRRGGQRQQPCWQVAGISQATFQQHHQIEENTRSQVQSVCSNSSLSPQQKQEQIRQLHEQAQKEMQNLVSPQQQEALRSCREQRGEQHGGGGMRHGGGEGGCGQMPAGNGPRNGRTQPQSPPQSQPEQ